MRKILIFLMIIPAILISAQSVDSLLLVLKNEKNVSHIPSLQNQISDAYKHSDPEQMQKFAIQALKNSRQQKNVYQEAVSYQNMGVSFLVLGDYDKALQNFNTSEKILLKISSDKKEIKETLAKNFGSQGIIFSEQNNYAKALDCDLQAMRIYEELGSKIQISKICNNIGVIYRSIDDNEKALKYFLKSNKIKKSGISCSNIGFIYLSKNDFSKALRFFDEALLEYKKEPNPRGLGDLYNNYASYFFKKGNLPQAKKYLFEAENTFLTIQDKFEVSDTYLSLAQIFLRENNLPKAILYSQKSLDIANELEITETKVNAEKLLSDIYDRKGDQKLALLHLRNYDVEKDNLEKIKNEQQRLKTELAFQYEKKQLEKRENANRERLKWIFTFTILGVLLLGLFFYYRNKEKQKTILLQKQLTEFEHKALHLQMNPHFVFNCLAAISAFVMQNGKDEAIRYLAKFSKLMRLTLEFSQESMITIDKEIEALQNYLELEQLRFNDKFDFNISKESNIEDDTVIPSLLLQPYVENAIIHGVVPKNNRGFIDITFRQIENELICIIVDNGVGIEQSKKNKINFVNAHKSMAMEISKKRLETLEQLENKKNELSITELRDGENVLGTQVLIKLPLEYVKNK